MVQKIHLNTSLYKDVYKDDDAIRPLCIKLPQMIGYVKNFNDNKTISFRVDDNKLLKKYDKIWEIISNLLNLIVNLFMVTIINI